MIILFFWQALFIMRVHHQRKILKMIIFVLITGLRTYLLTILKLNFLGSRRLSVGALVGLGVGLMKNENESSKKNNKPTLIASSYGSTGN